MRRALWPAGRGGPAIFWGYWAHAGLAVDGGLLLVVMWTMRCLFRQRAAAESEAWAIAHSWRRGCAGLVRLERSDDEAWIGFAAVVFGLADDAAAPAPAVQRPSHEVIEAPPRLSGLAALLGSLRQPGFDLGDQPFVLGPAKQIIDSVFFALRDQGLPC